MKNYKSQNKSNSFAIDISKWNVPIVLSRTIKVSPFEFSILNIIGLSDTDIPVLIIIRDKGDSYISLPYHAKEAVLGFVPKQYPEYHRMANGDIAEVYRTRGYYTETVEKCKEHYRNRDN